MRLTVTSLKKKILQIFHQHFKKNKIFVKSLIEINSIRLLLTLILKNFEKIVWNVSGGGEKVKGKRGKLKRAKY